MRYLLSTEPLPLPFEPRRAGGLWVYPNPGAMPRAFVARDVRVVPDAAERLRRLGADDFDPAVALLEAAPEDPLFERLRPAGELPGAVQVEAYEPRRVQLRAELERPGLLVLADAWDPGWSVSVNGEERPVLRVDHALRGVLLDGGTSAVRWEYDPASTRLGLALGAAALLGIFLLAGVRGRRG